MLKSQDVISVPPEWGERKGKVGQVTIVLDRGAYYFLYENEAHWKMCSSPDFTPTEIFLLEALFHGKIETEVDLIHLYNRSRPSMDKYSTMRTDWTPDHLKKYVNKVRFKLSMAGIPLTIRRIYQWGYILTSSENPS